jgi:hypothetical protein
MGKGLFVVKKVISIQFSKNNMLQGMATNALYVWSYLTTQTSIEKLEEIIKNDNTKKPTTKRPNSNKKTNKSNKHE